jgi:hypothetical protein
LLDLRCSGSDAPIVTPYRSTSQRHCQKRADRDAPSPARAGSFFGAEGSFDTESEMVDPYLRQRHSD